MDDIEEILKLLREGQVIYYALSGGVYLIDFGTHTSKSLDIGTFLDMRSDGQIVHVKTRTTGYPVCHGRVDVYDISEEP